MFKFIKWIIKTVLILTGSLPLFRCSSGYQEKNGKITFNGKEITDKNFIVLNQSFAKDDSVAYYKRYGINDADVKTFVALNNSYAKDKNNVFYCDEEREGQNYYMTKHSIIIRIKNAQPASFLILGKANGDYAKDDKRGYYKSIGFEVKDVASLKLMEGQFLKDRYQVYFEQKPIKNADVNSFRILNSCYAKDTARVYYYGYHNDLYNGINEIVCKPASFSILQYPYSKDDESFFYIYFKINSADAKTFSIVGNDFSKDRNHVYIKNKILNQADAATFVLIPNAENSLDESNYTKDKMHVFWKDEMFSGIDYNFFRVFGLNYSTDGKHIYYKTSIVKNADLATFKIYDHGYGDADAEDFKNKYLEGVKVVE